MIYLVIPVLCFIGLYLLARKWFPTGTTEQIHKGRADDIDRVLRILLTTGLGDPHLAINVSRRVTWIELAIFEDRMRLTMPLVTRLQRSRRDQLLERLKAQGLEAKIVEAGDGRESLECIICGSPEEVSNQAKVVTLNLFEVTDVAKFMEFRVQAHWTDQRSIEAVLRSRRADAEGSRTASVPRGEKADSYVEARSGCSFVLATLLLVPIPFIAAFLLFGFIAATVVWIITTVGRILFQRWFFRRTKPNRDEFIRGVGLMLGIATLYTGNPWYLQSIPTVWLGLLAIPEAIALVFNKPQLSRLGRVNNSMPPQMRNGITLVSVFACALGIAGNEYIRASLSLDIWVWFFAFLPIELAFAFLVTFIPLPLFMLDEIEKMGKSA